MGYYYNGSEWVTSFQGEALTYSSLSGAPPLPIPASDGGTGLASPGPSGQVLTSTGSEWESQALPTIAGPTGPIGPTGPTGPTGPQGETGPSGPTQLSNVTFDNVTIDGYTEGFVNSTISGDATLSISSATMQFYTISGNVTLTMPEVQAGKSFVCGIKNGSGSAMVTFDSVVWSSSGAPTSSKNTDWFTFWSDGTSWYGSAIQGFGG